MVVMCVVLARNLQAFSPSNRHLLGTAVACGRKNNSARAFFSTSPGEHQSSSKDVKNEEAGTIKFSTSKANNHVWSVEKALGSDHQKPWWKVLPFSLAGIALVVWCFFRKETDVDRIMEQSLSDHFPDLKLSDAEPKEVKPPSKAT
ncbi:ubiquinol-cytochrome c reductase complex assembly factor 4 [Narcine bancroftii]|uniref:ubiquinol-cytochrome c reductase complex assembly factor 4 n=1 Tax=Narcine bancroftii TaxID=1343680 RepID=UPI00383161BD